MQNWLSLSDEGIEDAIYDKLCHVQLHAHGLSHGSGVGCNHPPSLPSPGRKNKIGEKIFTDVKTRLEKAGLMMHDGTIVDATIISAPSSTKNQEGRRDPEMHQTQKGNQWYHGVKVHSSVDVGSGYVYTITGTAANVHDIKETSKLICGDDEVVYGNSGYSGADRREELCGDENLSKIEFRTDKRPSSIKVPGSYKVINCDKQIENRKSSTRCKVEHPFLIIKRQFGYAKVAYHGIAKNMNRFHILFVSTNLVMCVYERGAFPIFVAAIP